MKKSLLYGMMLTTVCFGSCKGDYDDWAAPQGYDAEEPKNISLAVTPTAAVNMEAVTAETVQLFTSSVNAPEGAKVTACEAILSKVDENGVAQGKTTLVADASGNVSVRELVSAVEGYYGKNPIERKLALVVSAVIDLNGQAFHVNSDKVETKVTLVKPDISEAYYLVGDMVGWTEALKMKFSHSDVNVYDDPVFTISFTTTADNQYWKIIPQKNIDGGNFFANPGVVGVKTDGDDALSGQLVNEGAGAGKIAKAGKYTMSINMLDYTYEIKPAPTELYMTGSAFDGWKKWHQLTPVHSHEGNYWTIIYCDAGDEFKFSAAAEWNGTDFGASAPMNDKAGAGLSDQGGNVKVTNAGWYLIHVLNGESRAINVYKPNVYLIGETAGEWNVADSHKFEIPTTIDGVFVSPAFAKDAELRMCVSIGGFDWWQTEFIIFNGKIEYRGSGPDQTRVSVTAGKKAYLNFSAGVGEIK
ncbi:uncharacterized protein DUF5019 [Bacteroides zoogleoformans]|uniref:DUF5115 domain-containing protein n=1 Tax=Bacteroides zoogleoformans TaxID=28119 RepID=A0ABM6TAF9_9BACE|nr:DUF5115 domain-containing protein [Bacteroides zoogleoformans]AVM53783.1 DUF5115 domain-containing protein [Bacteroides zoogleoformans]TWJ18202.1 uncharacterized protein DUF5019 [Bacteroides zoogleoformans]